MDIGNGLIGHWKLTQNCEDSSGNKNHGINHGVLWDEERKAVFNGRDSFIEVPHTELLALGSADFSICALVQTEKDTADVIGDIGSKFDYEARKGFNFNIKTHTGMCSNQTNFRNVHFGIDNAVADEKWTDCGAPGGDASVFALGMTVHEGGLFVGTCQPGANDAGHVYRYLGGRGWENCGAPDKSNTIHTLVSYNGSLYAGTGYYKTENSLLEPSPNKTPGGHVYRYAGGTGWEDCGRVGQSIALGALVEFKGALYASTYEGILFRYGRDKKWEKIFDQARGFAFGVYNGYLYLVTCGRAGTWRTKEGRNWKRVPGDPLQDQFYSTAIYRNRMWSGTWRGAAVYAFDGAEWELQGFPGLELETMGLAIYNGKLYAGTLPLGGAFRLDSGPFYDRWTLLEQLDKTPDVRYRRLWSMAVYDGKLFAGTLPSAKVYSFEAGKNVTYDYALPAGPKHIAAIRSGGALKLYIDGKVVSESSSFDPALFDITNERPLLIGNGAHDCFNGRISDFRIYNRALNDDEVGALSTV